MNENDPKSCEQCVEKNTTGFFIVLFILVEDNL